MGKRHHYIPQFLLRNFASKRSPDGVKHWVHQITKHGTSIEATTRDVALEKYFYGKESEVEVLLSSIEGEGSLVLKQLIEGKDPNAYSFFLSEFVWLQSLRTRAAKSAMTQAFSSAIRGLFHAANASKLQERIVSRLMNNFDDIITKELPTRPLSEQIVIEELLNTPGFPRIIRDAMIAKLAKDNVVDTIQRMFVAIGYSGLIEEEMNKGFNASIEKLVREPKAPDRFKFTKWTLRHFENQELVLGDTCTFAVYDGGRIGSFMKFDEQEAELQCVVLPISSRVAIIGSNLDVQFKFSSSELNFASASLSWDFLYSHSKEDGYLGLGRKIGTIEPIVDEATIREIVKNAWEE